MTVPTSDNREQYLGNDSTTVFGYVFKIFRDEDLEVYLVEGDTQTLQTLGTDYSVSGAGNESGGNVTMTTAPTSSQTLVILRIVAVVQETDLRNQGAYYPETVEDEFDRGRMIDQQQQDEINRTLRRPEALDYWDAEGRNIRNVKDAAELDDAVNKGQMDARFSDDVITKTGSHWDGKGLQARNFSVRSPVQDSDLPNMAAIKAYFTSLESGTVGDTTKVTAEGTTDQRALAAWMKALGYPTTSTGTDQPLAEALDDRSITVNTVAELKASPLQAGNGVLLTESGRNGSFVIKAGTPPTDPQEGIYIVLANGNYAEREYSGAVDVKWFGAAGDGVRDDTTSIEEAIRLSKGLVFISAGDYLITREINITTSNRNIMGASPGASRITTNSATANFFKLGDGLSQIQNLNFEEFSVWSTVVKTAGSVFAGTMVARSHWERIHMADPVDYGPENRLWDGIDLDQFDYCTVSECHILTQHEGVACNGNPSSLFGAGLWINDGTKIAGQTSPGGSGVHIGGGAGGVYLQDCDIIGNFNNVRVSTDRQPGVINREVFFGSTATLDSAGNAGVLVQENSLTHLDISGTWISSAGLSSSDRPGLEVAPNNAGLTLKMSGPRIFNNAGGGIVINGGSFTLNGGEIFGNGKGTGTLRDGISAPNAAIVQLSVTGASIHDNGSTGVGYGINIASGFDNYQIKSNNLYGNSLGQIKADNGNNKRIRDNLGVLTENAGDGTIIGGAGSVTINHGLDPNISGGKRVQVTPLGSASEFPFYASVPNATSFVIQIGGTATRNNDFQWHAYFV